ncbi:MAG: hypothetical protein HYS45_00985 [Parcubacteria group bacterium]|nr:hypothetical protein [Parcubacteria group bacterium]
MASEDAVDVHQLFEAASLVSQAGIHSLRAACELVGSEVFSGLLVGVVFSELPKHPRGNEREIAEEMVCAILREVQAGTEAAQAPAR